MSQTVLQTICRVVIALSAIALIVILNWEGRVRRSRMTEADRKREDDECENDMRLW